jgi:hypothetical protein
MLRVYMLNEIKNKKIYKFLKNFILSWKNGVLVLEKKGRKRD